MAGPANNKVQNRQEYVARSSEGLPLCPDFFRDTDEIRDIAIALYNKMNEMDKSKKNFARQGAIPKGYNFEEHHQLNPYKWYKNNKRNSSRKQHKNENRIHENGTKTATEMTSGAEIRPSSSTLSLNSECEQSVFRRHSPYFPFYYVVPENPSPVNLLRPGTYLVIPQNKILNQPLQVVRHPTQLDKEYGNETGDGDPVNSPWRRNQSNSWESQNTKSNKYTNSNKGGKMRPISSQERKVPSEEKCKNQKPVACAETKQDGSGGKSSKEDEKLSNDSQTSENGEHLCSSRGGLSDSQLASLLNQLPYFDENYLIGEWNKKKEGQTFDAFMEELKERRINDVYVRILTNAPTTSPSLLQEKISEIMVSDEAVRSFIELENLKESEKVLEMLKGELSEFDEEEIVNSYYKFKDMFEAGEDKKLLTFIRNELLTRRQEENKFQQLQIISAMLPDADADYLLSRLNDIDGDGTKLNEFIEELLDTPDYPKAVEFDPKSRERQKLWNYYMTNYSPASYLKKVPDPEQFFSGSSVRDHNISRECAIKFLETRYPDLDSFQLNEAFTCSDESLLKTCKLLDRNYLPEISVKEALKSNPLTEAFLQEVTFIIHKDEILKHIKEENERRLLEIQRAEEENSFFECLVCYDENVILSEAVVCPDGHIVCRRCLVTYIGTLFSEGKHLFPCLSGTCDTEYTMKTMEKSLDPNLFSKIAQRRAAEDVDKAGVPGLEKCPSCDFAYIPAPEDKIFTCSNEDCMRVTCRLCKEDNHIPLSCEEVERPKDILARQQVEEAMTKQLIRSCPKCSKKFIKIDGCNKITCPCGVIMCYICLQIVNDYSHFNGMGGLDLHKCPLYSENRKLHVVEVLEAGVREKEKIKKENPNVNFVYDPTATIMNESRQGSQ